MKVTYRPSQIRALYGNRFHYESMVTPLGISPIRDRDLEEYPTLAFKTDTVFLQVLVRGQIDLLFHEGKNQLRNLFIRRNEKLELLLFKKYISMRPTPGNSNLESKVILYDNTFRNQLLLQMGDCQSDLGSRIAQLRYEADDIMKLIVDYHLCIGKPVLLKDDGLEGYYEWDVTAGAALTAMQLIEKKPDPFTLSQFDKTITPLIGLTVRHYIKGNSYLSFMGAYSSIQNNGYYHRSLNENHFTEIKSKHNAHYLTLRPVVCVKPISQSNFYLLGGVIFGLKVAGKGTVTRIDQFYTARQTATSNFKSGLNYGITAGFGGYIGKIGFEASGSLSNISINKSLFGGIVQRYCLLVHYNIISGKK